LEFFAKSIKENYLDNASTKEKQKNVLDYEQNEQIDDKLVSTEIKQDKNKASKNNIFDIDSDEIKDNIAETVSYVKEKAQQPSKLMLAIK
jgi:hypothetical protein